MYVLICMYCRMHVRSVKSNSRHSFTNRCQCQQCMECGEDSLMRGAGLGRGHRDWNCPHCHSRLHLEIEQAEIKKVVARRPSMGVGSVAVASEALGTVAASKRQRQVQQRGASRNRPEEVGVVKLGQPLPRNGACDHYTKSMRWLRFPCCGRAYPCDVCHGAYGYACLHSMPLRVLREDALLVLLPPYRLQSYTSFLFPCSRVFMQSQWLQ